MAEVDLPGHPRPYLRVADLILVKFQNLSDFIRQIFHTGIPTQDNIYGGLGI